ncbi:tripartite tricarboxylate transporter substrate binding protein [Allopusillimonas soli]|uniref:Tripartite tricarboxylate transporter substrate binding protein n=1 Tax=Allopusillimonas soli TaxID=659016 RepID=A0A853F7B6_9BURK|nr:tripartite tricarboxylate transporter substrate binding protein [Allopusillimonas soli]NYT35993.1 tripartite tricarboxylate transporter substrate binding protein [Allopusillimonas soli]TEA76337.1 tripartite tricarboxylate transporter substrate binding protein [Allopusillimonas soli]
MLKIHQCLGALCALALAATLHPAVASGAWPQQAVRLIVPYPAGGGTDFSTRLIASELSKRTGQEFIVENKTGASGTIGAQTVARSAPDGYTLLVASPAEVLVGQIAGQKTAYDPKTDLLPITLVGETPLAITVHPSVPAKTLPELLALSKSEPMSYGTPGVGSTMQFAGESLNLVAGTNIMHVAYRGAAPAITDLLGDQIPMAIVGMPPVINLHQTGKLRIVAVTSERRSSVLPDVPAVSELDGYAKYRFTNWYGIYAPKGTDPAILEKMAQWVGEVVRQPEIKAQLQQKGVEPVGNTPAEFAQFLREERERYEAVQKRSGIHIN